MDKVRCPYCVSGNGFRRMVRHSNFTFLCDKCGHSVVPKSPTLRCSCRRCTEIDSQGAETDKSEATKGNRLRDYEFFGVGCDQLPNRDFE